MGLTKPRPTARTPEAEIEIIDLAERRLAKLEVENRRLAAEMRRLRDKLPPTRHESIIHQAASDAKTILHLRHAQFDVTRRRMAVMGLVSEFHYGWALAMLRAARVNDADVSTLEGLAAAIERVEDKVKFLLDVDGQGDHKLRIMRTYAGKRYYRNRYAR